MKKVKIVGNRNDCLILWISDFCFYELKINKFERQYIEDLVGLKE